MDQVPTNDELQSMSDSNPAFTISYISPASRATTTVVHSLDPRKPRAFLPKYPYRSAYGRSKPICYSKSSTASFALASSREATFCLQAAPSQKWPIRAKRREPQQEPTTRDSRTVYYLHVTCCCWACAQWQLKRLSFKRLLLDVKVNVRGPLFLRSLIARSAQRAREVREQWS